MNVKLFERFASGVLAMNVDTKIAANPCDKIAEPWRTYGNNMNAGQPNRARAIRKLRK